MARLRAKSPPRSDGSDDSDFVQNRANVWRAGTETATTLPTTKARSSPRKKPTTTYHDDMKLSDGESIAEVRLQPKTTPQTQKRGKQIRLAPLHSLDILRPIQSDAMPTKSSSRARTPVEIISPRKAKSSSQPRPLSNFSKTAKASTSYSLDEVEVEESIWCGSDASSENSDDEVLPSPRKFVRLPRRIEREDARTRERPPEFEGFAVESRDLQDPPADLPKSFSNSVKNGQSASSRPGSSSDKENAGAFLHFSPPRLYKPPKSQTAERPVTPPQSPSKSKLQSPSKTKTRIPTPPLIRQNLDAFWNADTVNDWNDQYSPQKVLKSPRKLKLLQDDASASPTSSPRKLQSPSKRSKAEIEAKKDFASQKHRIAAEFLLELDQVVTQGKIKELAASSGGVHFIWSKTLNSTAGRANWRRESTKIRHLDGTTSTTHKHFASIELAEKVINDENRLLNVIAHEFCHLANFMVSGIKDQPHGRQFKDWGRKTTAAFKHKGVEVTTKHSYQIEYKYIWQCSNVESCGVEFKRHSKSVDPKRHTCGTCRSKLVQIKPVPRKDAVATTGYAAFVKQHFADVKKALPGASQKEVMEAVGKKYRAEKAAAHSSSPLEVAIDAGGAKTNVDVESMTRNLEVIVLDDD